MWFGSLDGREGQVQPKARQGRVTAKPTAISSQRASAGFCISARRFRVALFRATSGGVPVEFQKCSWLLNSSYSSPSMSSYSGPNINFDSMGLELMVGRLTRPDVRSEEH